MKKKDAENFNENLEDFSFDSRAEETKENASAEQNEIHEEEHVNAKTEKHSETCGHGCGCDEDCGCDENCDCGEECACDETCTCGEHEKCDCEEHGGQHGHHHGHHNQDLAAQYLALAQHLQADFDNYRKRVAEQLDYQRQEGVKSVLEVFLPCLDTFKEAKKSITDENVLSGINMIENKILSALKTLNVEKIESIGKVYDPHLHNAIAVMRDESKDSDVILEEYQSGWKLGDKVIKYAQVVVNKLG